jgi:LysM repeat protein
MNFWTAGQAITADLLNAMIPQTGVAPGQTVSSTSPQPVTGFTADVESGNTYIVYCKITLDAGAGGGQGEFRFTGPASPTLCVMQMSTAQVATATVTVGETDVETATGYNSGFLDTQTLAGTRYRVQIWMTLTPSADGTLALEVANVAGASDTFSVQAGSYMRVEQVLS